MSRFGFAGDTRAKTKLEELRRIRRGPVGNLLEDIRRRVNPTLKERAGDFYKKRMPKNNI
jgi:hypothetical protein